MAYLESLVLQDTLDGCILTRRREFGLKDDTKTSIADDLALSVLHLFGFAGQAILHLLANHFGTCFVVSMSLYQWQLCPPLFDEKKKKKKKSVEVCSRTTYLPF